MHLNHAIDKFTKISPDHSHDELLHYVRDNYRAYCPKCGSVISFADRSADDYLGACLECDEDFYAVECYLEEVQQ